MQRVDPSRVDLLEINAALQHSLGGEMADAEPELVHLARQVINPLHRG